MPRRPISALDQALSTQDTDVLIAKLPLVVYPVQVAEERIRSAERQLAIARKLSAARDSDAWDIILKALRKVLQGFDGIPSFFETEWAILRNEDPVTFKEIVRCTVAIRGFVQAQKQVSQLPPAERRNLYQEITQVYIHLLGCYVIYARRLRDRIARELDARNRVHAATPRSNDQLWRDRCLRAIRKKHQSATWSEIHRIAQDDPEIQEILARREVKLTRDIVRNVLAPRAKAGKKVRVNTTSSKITRKNVVDMQR